MRHLFRVFFLFIFCFYGLYILIDYSSHTASFQRHSITSQWSEMTAYYLAEFSRRMDILLPFALMLACIRTLTTMNAKNELVALLAGGLPIKRLLKPFFIVALSLTACLYINLEMLLPLAEKTLNSIEEIRRTEKHKLRKIVTAQSLLLEDLSPILYHHFDEDLRMLTDAYWVRSANEVYHIHQLSPYQQPPVGYGIDLLRRDADGHLSAVAFYEKQLLPEMRFSEAALQKALTVPADMPLTALWHQAPPYQETLSDKEAILLSTFYHKLVMPWLPFLALLAVAPFCMRFSRVQYPFFIYACSIFGLIAVYLIMNAALVLGERQVLHPEWAIFCPFALILGFFLWRYFYTTRLLSA